MKALLIYNNHSGNNKIKKKVNYILNNLIDKFEITCFESCGIGSIKDYIIVNGSNYDLIIIAGGDGTIHEAVNGIMKLSKRPTISFIPSGTCNDAARTLGYTKNLKKNILKIKEFATTEMDVSYINNSYFLYGLAAGFMTDISYKVPQKSKIIFGRIAYYLYILKTLKYSNVIDAIIKYDNVVYNGKYSVFLATNSRFLAGFRLRRKKNDNLCLNDGKLRVVLFDNNTKLINLFLFAKFLLFGCLKSKYIKAFDTSNLLIESMDKIAYNADGEFNSNDNKIEVKVIHNAIRVVADSKIIKKYFK